MIDLLSSVIVAAAGVYMAALGLGCWVAPQRVGRFLLAFAGSARAHFAEMAIRLVVGAAFVLHAPHMRFTSAFHAFGWILLVTTAVLLFVPWRLHHRFAQCIVPPAVRHLRLVGFASLAFGVIVLTSFMRGPA